MSLTTSLSKSRSQVRVPQQRVVSERPSHQRVSSWLSFIPGIALAVDLLCIAVAILVAGVGRFSAGVFTPSAIDYMPRVSFAAPLITIGWVLTIAALGGYQKSVFGAGTDEFRRIVNSAFVAAALTGIGCYLLRVPLSRGFFVLSIVIGLALLLVGRLVLRHTIRNLRERGSLLHRVLIVGSVAHVDEVASVLARESWLGYDVVGALTPAGSTAQPANGVPVVGSTFDVAQAATKAQADVVFLAGGAVDSAAALRQIAWELEPTSAQLVVAPSLTDVSPERVRIRPVGGLPLLHLEKPRAAHAAKWAKRVFDAVGSFWLLVVFSPLILTAAYQIWRHDRGPIFFRQERIGRNGAPFKCWKFRTMVTDAEARLAAVHATQGSEQGVFAKIKDDPRVTRPGRWLRRLSLDELPQLVNVLKGDMSLVGPRPQVAHEVALYDYAMSRRLHVRPGMTGLWQVSGRSDLSLEEAIRLDLYYVDNWSMVQDLSILSRTFGAVVGSRGAY